MTHIQHNYVQTGKEGVKRAAGAGYLQNPPQSLHVVLLTLDNGTQDVPPHNLSGRANKTADSCFRMHTGQLYLQVKACSLKKYFCQMWWCTSLVSTGETGRWSLVVQG